MLDFSIITPSYRNGDWLKLCIASIADQHGITLEHIVQDAGSDDGTLEWLSNDPRVSAHIEKDGGMYDAINRGFKRATGEYVAYLNCDEQYLPGALSKVKAHFDANPDVDVILSDLLVIDARGEYICHRRSMIPYGWHLWHRFNMTTCSVFIRRSSLEKYQLFFDIQWRVIGDLFWYFKMVQQGIRFSILREYTSVFTETGANLALSESAKGEQQRKLALMPAWCGKARPLVLMHHKLRMALTGTFQQKPFSYSLYTLDSPSRRVDKVVTKPKALWIRP